MSPAARVAVETALFEGALLRVVYEGSHGTTHRRLQLRNVVMEGSVTLLNTTDIDTNEQRQLRLDRLTSIHVIADDAPDDSFKEDQAGGRRRV